MKKEYILFIDSGIGGLSTLAETYKILPANYIYFSDNKNHPYGKHSRKEILLFLKQIIDKVRNNFNIKIVVLACNTATTSAIESLRSFYRDLCFVGTEPAIKQAYDLGYRNILVLSTPLTAKQKKYKTLKLKFSDANISTKSMQNFAHNIEAFYHASSPLYNLKLIKDLFVIKNSAKNHDAIVLGCTHYCLVKRQIKQFAGLPLISGNSGVSMRVFDKFKQISEQKNLQNMSLLPIFLFSTPSKSLEQKYIKIFSQILANHENVC